MQTFVGLVCRAVVLAAAVVAVTRILKHLRGASSGAAVLPTITGDTWPPVPVKSSRYDPAP
jgi:uncharacterized membrane protein